MTQRSIFLQTVALMVALVCGTLAQQAQAQSRNGSRDQLSRPIYRVAKNPGDKRAPTRPQPAAQPRQQPQVPPRAQAPARPAPKAAAAKKPAHPLDPTLNMAREALVNIRKNVKDYTATMVKRETVNGKLTQPETTFIKVRHRQAGTTPFSIYMSYLKPKARKGQEAIWMEGRNNNKIVGHGTGLQGLVTVYLDPDGIIPTMGTNYKIYDSGLEKLVEKLIERAERERRYPECEVQYFQNAKINDRKCTVIQLTHPVQRPHFEFHVARVFIDDEYKVPIRYAAYNWPTTAGGNLRLIEEFTYYNININVGLTDRDFDHRNPEYKYPGR